MIYRKMESFLHIESISEIYLINVFVKRIKSTASLRGSIPNNYSAVYQKELTLLLIQESLPLRIAFRNRPRELT